MALLKDPDLLARIVGDQGHWHGYEIIETPSADKAAVHEAAVQARLNVLRNIEPGVLIKAINTTSYTKDTPMPEVFLITTIEFGVLGDPDIYPIP